MRFEHLLDALSANAVNTLEYADGDRIVAKTFQDVHGDVAEMMSRLAAAGLRRGDRAGIWFDNDYSWIVLDLACFALGVVSVPFHSDITSMDVGEAFRVFDLSVLFTASDVYARRDTGIERMTRQQFAAAPSHPAPRVESAGWTASSTFTILFTSGTTGFPKALELRIASVTDFIETASRLFEFRRDDKAIVFMPLSHFGQRSYIYAAILLGFNVALVSRAGLFAGFKRFSPTLLVAVPLFFEGVYRTFKQSENAEAVTRFLGGSMRLLLTGSAPIRREVLEFFERIGLPIYEGYGTTESGLIALNHPGAYRLGSVGRVFPNKEVRIDERGEVLVRGEFCWAERYLNQPEAVNAEVFGGDGYIHTGDIGYVDGDGFLYLSGRRKEMMVFSNGAKAHPGEIESSLQRHDAVMQACVFSSADAVCAVIVPGEGVGPDDVGAIVERANVALPDYARIRRYVVSREPFSSDNGLLTASLKLNRPHIAARFVPQLSAGTASR